MLFRHTENPLNLLSTSYTSLHTAIDATHTNVLQGLWVTGQKTRHIHLLSSFCEQEVTNKLLTRLQTVETCRAAQGTLAHTTFAQEAEQHPSMHKNGKNLPSEIAMCK